MLNVKVKCCIFIMYNPFGFLFRKKKRNFIKGIIYKRMETIQNRNFRIDIEFNEKIFGMVVQIIYLQS